MTDLKFEAYTLFSSSKGNCVFIKNGNTKILIDAGRPMKGIEEALRAVGSSLSEIDAIFITHAHSDHTKGLNVIGSRYNMPIHMTINTALELGSGAVCERYCAHGLRYEIELADLKIHSFVIPHDSDGAVGYIIHSDAYTLGVCTDTGCITREMALELSVCNGAVIESNYDSEMLKNGPYPQFLKSRIEANTGHLSNEKCSELVCLLARAGVKKFMLAHLSPENNLPEKALRTSCEALCTHGYNDVEITIADKLLPTRF